MIMFRCYFLLFLISPLALVGHLVPCIKQKCDVTCRVKKLAGPNPRSSRFSIFFAQGDITVLLLIFFFQLIKSCRSFFELSGKKGKILITESFKQRRGFFSTQKLVPASS